jgi:hypothetical protein
VLPNHPEAWSDFQSVAQVWLGETVNEAGAVKVSSWSLMWNSDPWKGSRDAYRVLNAKWGNVK